MNAEKNINILGKEVRLRYCAATETGYEQISGNSIDIFIGKKDKPSEAKTIDYIQLAIAAMAAAYGRNGEDVPLKTEEIMYDCTPKEITAMILAVVELRAAWYELPSVISNEQKSEDSEKN